MSVDVISSLVGIFFFFLLLVTIAFSLFEALSGIGRFLHALMHPRAVVEHVVRRENELPVIQGTARPGKPQTGYRDSKEAAGAIEAMGQLRNRA